MKSLRTLIVEDEPLVRAGIREDLSRMDGVEIAAEAGSVEEALGALRGAAFDLALLDIQLPDGTGFDVVERLGAARMPAVVFLTAYDHYAIQAFEVNAIDYVLKPYDESRLRAAVERARTSIDQPAGTLVRQLEGLLEARTSAYPKKIVVRDGELYEFIAVDSIDWAESANNYVVLHCGTREHVLRERLSNLEARLDPGQFQRVHRCHLINKSRLKSAFQLPGGDYELKLESGVALRAGRQYAEAFRRLLKEGL